MTFLASPADIAIYGGGAGGGKTWALLMEPLRHVANKEFGAVFFRRTTVQIRNEGGLWDESARLYPLIDAEPKEHDLWWRFPSGASVTFAHLEHDKTVLGYQASRATGMFSSITDKDIEDAENEPPPVGEDDPLPPLAPKEEDFTALMSKGGAVAEEGGAEAATNSGEAAHGLAPEAGAEPDSSKTAAKPLRQDGALRRRRPD